MADDQQSTPHATQRVKASADPQVQALITDPARYVAQARAAARREARLYVRSRAHRPRPA